MQVLTTTAYKKKQECNIFLNSYCSTFNYFPDLKLLNKEQISIVELNRFVIVVYNNAIHTCFLNSDMLHNFIFFFVSYTRNASILLIKCYFLNVDENEIKKLGFVNVELFFIISILK